MHVIVDLFFQNQTNHELPFDELVAIDSSISTDDEYQILIDRLPFIVPPMANPKGDTSVPSGLSIQVIRVPDQIERKYFDSFVKRDGLKFVESAGSVVFLQSFPHIIPQLPSVYQKLYTSTLHMKCLSCDSVPKTAVMCLLCGDYLCCNGECCRRDNVGEVTHHYTTRCSPNGYGVFMRLSTSMVYVTAANGKLVTPWGSLYLDSHGEEDYTLSRPLMLNMEKVKRLTAEIQENSFEWKAGSKGFDWKPVSFL
jgi:hypothetical protein